MMLLRWRRVEKERDEAFFFVFVFLFLIDDYAFQSPLLTYLLTLSARIEERSV